MIAFKLGDRVYLSVHARETVTWGKNKYRQGTIARVDFNRFEYSVLWDGKQSIEQCDGIDLEKVGFDA